MPLNIQPTDIWPATGILIGFQVTSFTWRVSREVEVGKRGDVTWLPPADIVNLLSMVTAVVGVFIFPTLGLADVNFMKHAFGLALLLFVGYAFALAGHYDLYNNKTPRSFKYFPLQEKIVIAIIATLAIVYVIATNIWG